MEQSWPAVFLFHSASTDACEGLLQALACCIHKWLQHIIKDLSNNKAARLSPVLRPTMIWPQWSGTHGPKRPFPKENPNSANRCQFLMWILVRLRSGPGFDFTLPFSPYKSAECNMKKA